MRTFCRQLVPCVLPVNMPAWGTPQYSQAMMCTGQATIGWMLTGPCLSAGLQQHITPSRLLLYTTHMSITTPTECISQQRHCCLQYTSPCTTFVPLAIDILQSTIPHPPPTTGTCRTAQSRLAMQNCSLQPHHAGCTSAEHTRTHLGTPKTLCIQTVPATGTSGSADNL
jgi:hypothetical protein